MFLRSCSLALLAVAAASCSAGPIPIAGYAAQLVDAKCQKYARCGAIAASEVAQCNLDGQRLLSYPPLLPAAAEVAAGRLGYDAAAARACVEAYLSASCSVDLDPMSPKSCPAAFTPKVVGEGACLDSIECKTGYCASGGAGCTGNCTPFILDYGAACTVDESCGPMGYCDGRTSQCAARSLAGAACDAASRCAAGLYCEGGDAHGGAGTCRSPGQIGAACHGPYAVGDDCAPGLVCDTSSSPSTCRALLAEGSGCAATSACRPGLGCRMAKGAATGTCTAWLDLDGACDPTLTGACPSDAFCDTTLAVCTAFGVGRPGIPCQDRSGCSVGLFEPYSLYYCDGGGHCAPVIGLGKACTPPAFAADEPCHASTCDPQAMVCVARCK